jgi:hypothetical protein
MTKTVRTEVWVGIYVHQHGRDLSIYPTAGEAEAGRQGIAEEW